ncbi:hypothetical protein F4604DRAFT_287064 [Suillus subluteus]|nr:hypothetical protein F4604DRAFT_287064 [Suillus subluteus]
MPEVISAELLDKLPATLFTAMHPDHDGRLNASQDLKYIHIIFAMTKNDEWCQRLADNYHLQRCISLVTVDGVQMYDRDVGFYLTVIIGRLYPISRKKNVAFDSLPTQSHSWWTLIKNTWMYAPHSVGNDEYFDGIPTLVTVTKCRIFSGGRPADVTKKVEEALRDLRKPDRQAIFTKNGITQARINDAIDSVQDLWIYLGGVVEQPKTSQMNDGALGL